MKCVDRVKFMCVCVTKIQGNMEHAMLKPSRTVYGSCNGCVHVSVMFWGCICKDGVVTITVVEGNIKSAKYIVIDIIET